MAARRRTTLAVQFFDLHPIRRGLKAGAFVYLQDAVRLAVDPQSRALRRADIKQCFHRGSELLRWLRPSLRSKQESDELSASVLGHISQSDLPPELKLKFASLVGRRPRGRPQESKSLAVTALEAKLARPEATWMQIAALLCPCPKHNEYCGKNLEAQVKRLRSLLRKTGLVPLIVASAKPLLLKRNLQELLGEER